MFWILPIIVGTMLHGLANILDNYFSNKLFKKIGLMFFFI